MNMYGQATIILNFRNYNYVMKPKYKKLLELSYYNPNILIINILNTRYNLIATITNSGFAVATIKNLYYKCLAVILLGCSKCK